MLLTDQARMMRAAVAAVCASVLMYLLTDSIGAALLALAGATVSYRIGTTPVLDDADPAPPPVMAPPPAPGFSTAEIDALIQALPDPALIVRSGRIARANSAALTLFGRHVVGQDARLAIRHPAVTEYLVGPRAGREAAHMEVVGLGAPDQSWELRVAPLADQLQFVLLSDLSSRHAAERMRVDFVANASHELRTPLAGILGFIETLSDPETGSDQPTRERFLSIMEGEARRMQRLVSDLISLSRVEAEKYRRPDQTVDLVEVIEEAVHDFRHSGDPRADDIAVDIDIGCPAVRGDRPQLSQLVHNLVSNSMKYGRPGTPVTIHLGWDGDATIRLGVTDEGDGISAEHLPRLTERFYRIDSSRSRAMGGTGLGLAIVKHIVERHRGRLHIDSVPKKGTAVTINLPMADASGEASSSPGRQTPIEGMA